MIQNAEHMYYGGELQVSLPNYSLKTIDKLECPAGGPEQTLELSYRSVRFDVQLLV